MKKNQQEIAETKKSKQKLGLSEKDFRNLFDNTVDLVYSIDTNGKIIYANNAWKSTFGYTNEDIKEKSIYDIMHPDSLDGCKKCFNSTFIGKKNHKKEFVFLTKDNRSITCESNIICDFKNGKRISSTGILKDVTIHRQIEKEIRKSEEKYRTIYDQAYIGFVQMNLKGEILHINQEFCNITKYTKEELFLKTFADISVPTEYDVCIEYIEKLKKGEENSFTVGKRLLHKNGSVIYVNITISIVRDAKGAPDYFVAIVQDITEKKETEEKIKNQSAKLNAIFESSSHQIYTINKNFKLTSFNRNYATEIFNDFAVHPKIDMDVRELMFDKKEVATLIKVWKSAFKGNSQHFENRIVNKKGEIVWYETHLDPIFLYDGLIEELAFITHNITEIKQSEEKIVHSLKEKEILLKEVHHRVKNNLQIISSILNLNTSYIQDKSIIGMFRGCQDRIMSMAFIHENLYQTKDFSNVNFSEYVGTLSKNLVYSYAGFREGIKLKMEVENILLNIDLAIPCGLIINELISNSLKHAFPEGKKGEVYIGVSSEGREIKITIKDDGVGLPKNINYRNTISLGLQLVVTLVDQLDGNIKLERASGTKYSITFKQ